MGEGPSGYPDLAHFLDTEFIQDPDDRRSIDDVARDFRSIHATAAVRSTAADLRRLLRNHPNDIEAAYEGFHPQGHPPSYGYSTAEWLAQIAELLERPG